MSAEEIVPKSGRQTWRFVLTAAGLMLLTLMVFGRTVTFDYINIDDGLHTTANYNVSTGLSWENAWWAFTSVSSPYWHPVTWLSLQLDATLFGVESAWGFHLVNVLWHMVNAVLALVVIQRLTGEFWPSALVAAWFALHPMRAESVAWVTERKDMLAVFFWLLAMLAYTNYVRRPGWIRYGLVLAWMALGLASKAVVMTLPAALLLLDFWPLERLCLGPGPRLSRGQKGTLPAWLVVAEKAPMLLMSLGVAYLIIVASKWELTGLEEVGWNDRISMILSAYLAYVENTFVPIQLVFFPAVPSSYSLERLGLALLVLVGITVFLAYAQPRLLVGWFWFLGILVPTIGVVQAGQTAPQHDRFTYVPHLGLFLTVVFGAKFLADRWHVGTRWRVGAGLTSVVILSLLCFRQVGYWKDSEALLTRTVELEPDSPIANAGLAQFYFRAGKVKEARKFGEQALKNAPSFQTHLLLGDMKSKEDNYLEAARHYEAALVYWPRGAEAMVKLGMILHQLDMVQEGNRYFKECVKILESGDLRGDPFLFGMAYADWLSGINRMHNGAQVPSWSLSWRKFLASMTDVSAPDSASCVDPLWGGGGESAVNFQCPVYFTPIICRVLCGLSLLSILEFRLRLRRQFV